MVKKLSSAVMLLLVALPLLAQPAGRGVIVAANPMGTESLSQINPFDCDWSYRSPCVQMTDWLYPTLFATDPLTGAVLPAAADNYGLVENPLLAGEGQQALRLRQDMTWSDGVPVTTYDVLFSFIVAMGDFNFGVRPMENVSITAADAYTLIVEFAEPDCAAPAQMNFHIVPAHVYAPSFAIKAQRFIEQYPFPQTDAEWHQTRLFEPYNLAAAAITPVTAGPFEFDSLRPFESIRLKSGETAFVYADLPLGVNAVEHFIAGGSTILINPPLNRREDLRAKPSLQIADVPSEMWAALTFNFADPNRPRSAYDNEGNPRDQGRHPIMNDIAVRQAIRLAIDVDEIIEVAYQGHAQPLASLWPPTSWAHDPARTRIEYDFRAAEDLLQAAGWRDTDGDGIRECRECSTARVGTPLSFNMAFSSRLSRVADIIRRQLERIGINAIVGGSDPSAQQFGLFLGLYQTQATDDPDLHEWFSHEYDRVGWGEAAPNYGSYHDAEIERLFDEARTVPSCDIAVRRELYGRIQDAFDTGVIVIPLLVETDMIAVQPSVLGFDPLPGRPLWNIRDWVVLP